MQNTTAFLFPGQGSQRVGMLAALSAAFEVVSQTFTEASDALSYDLWKVVQEDAEDQLNLTEYTQPALLASSVAIWRVWRSEGGKAPAFLAGHSLGELSALCCADAIALADAVSVVRERGRAMQTAVPVGLGAMAAVLGLDDETITGICAQCSSPDSRVEAVNFNAPGQVVIAGHTEAVNSAVEALKTEGAKRALPLPVSAPFHTSLMRPAGDRLSEVLASTTLHSPAIPVVHNVHAKTESDPERIRHLLVEQVSSPVLWTACVATLIDSGATEFAECGPGKVLGGLMRRIDRTLSCDFLEEPDSLRSALSVAT